MKLITLCAILLTTTLAAASCPPVTTTIQPVTMPDLPSVEQIEPSDIPVETPELCLVINDHGSPTEICGSCEQIVQWLTQDPICRARIHTILAHALANRSSHTPERMQVEQAIVDEIDTLLKECP